MLSQGLEEFNFDFRYVRLCELDMVGLFASSRYSHQTPRSAASDLGLHCLPIILIGVSLDYNGNRPKGNNRIDENSSKGNNPAVLIIWCSLNHVNET